MSTAYLIGGVVMLIGIFLMALGGIVAGVQLIRDGLYGPGILIIGLTLVISFGTLTAAFDANG